MHTFLRRQQIHYRIYIIEQLDALPFNRAKLMNVGAKLAMRAGFPCLVLHDVDLLPLRPANLYACTQNPRHLSSSINKFRWVIFCTTTTVIFLFNGSKQVRKMRQINPLYTKSRITATCRYNTTYITSQLHWRPHKTSDLHFEATFSNYMLRNQVAYLIVTNC